MRRICPTVRVPLPRDSQGLRRTGLSGLSVGPLPSGKRNSPLPRSAHSHPAARGRRLAVLVHWPLTHPRREPIGRVPPPSGRTGGRARLGGTRSRGLASPRAGFFESARARHLRADDAAPSLPRAHPAHWPSVSIWFRDRLRHLFPPLLPGAAAPRPPGGQRGERAREWEAPAEGAVAGPELRARRPQQRGEQPAWGWAVAAGEARRASRALRGGRCRAGGERPEAPPAPAGVRAGAAPASSGRRAQSGQQRCCGRSSGTWRPQQMSQPRGKASAHAQTKRRSAEVGPPPPVSSAVTRGSEEPDFITDLSEGTPPSGVPGTCRHFGLSARRWMHTSVQPLFPAGWCLVVDFYLGLI